MAQLVAHRYFQAHITPLQLFNRATDPFLPAVRPHTFAVLEDLDERGLRNHVLVITRHALKPDDAERLNQLVNLKVTLLFTYSGITDQRIEPYPSSVAVASLKLMSTIKPRRYRTVLYWRPLVPGLNDTDAHLTLAYIPMTLRPCSDPGRGLFVSVDGPSGAGKSTIVRHLAQMLVAAGKDVHVTAEPSNGPIGELCRELTDTVTGHALACLYPADRYHHIETEIRPACDAGKIVMSDRYLASGLVMQRFDDIDLSYLWQVNAMVLQPNLAVILEADPVSADVAASTPSYCRR